MKKVTYLILGIWSAVASFLCPVWVTVTFLHLSGRIYQLDPTMDEGTAVIMGGFLLLLWVLAALLPNLIFLRKTKLYGYRYLMMAALGELCLALLCCGMCGWNITRLLFG